MNIRLSPEAAAELRELTGSRAISVDMTLRVRIVLWPGEGQRHKDIAELLELSARTVDRWKTRFAEQGLA